MARAFAPLSSPRAAGEKAAFQCVPVESLAAQHTLCLGCPESSSRHPEGHPHLKPAGPAGIRTWGRSISRHFASVTAMTVGTAWKAPCWTPRSRKRNRSAFGCGLGRPACSGRPTASGSSSEKGDYTDDTAKEPSRGPTQPSPNTEVAWNLLCLNLSSPTLEAMDLQCHHPQSGADSSKR